MGKIISYLTEISSLRVGGDEATAAYLGDVEVWSAFTPKPYFATKALSSGTISFSGTSVDNSANTISYSTDSGRTWSTPSSSVTVNVNSGDTVMWKGTMTPISDDQQWVFGIGAFSSTINYEAEGNIMSLLFGDNFSGQTSLSGKNNAFTGLFLYNQGLVNAENLSLPATTLSDYCYNGMFAVCPNLEKAPTLPATALTDYCYAEMFSQDWALETAPQLPATTLASNCYINMFNGCTGMTTAPQLPATALAESCYESMFHECWSLEEAPQLPAQTLVTSCYKGMFGSCSSLSAITCLATDISASNCTSNWVSNVATAGTFTKAASMTAWTVGNNGIPTNWTVLELKPYFATKILSDGTIGFNSSTQNTVCYSTDSGRTWSTASTTPRVYVQRGDVVMWKGEMTPNTNGIGTFSSTTAQYEVEGNIMSLLFGDNFSGQTSLNGKNYAFRLLFSGSTTLVSAENLELPATTLSNYCYQTMFNDCTSLKTAPTLSATTLVDGCYGGLFRGCSSLSAITCLATDISATNCTTNWTNGVAASGVFTKATSMTGWTTGVNGIPTNWEVENEGDHDYSQDYFTTRALGSGSISFSGSLTANTISYSMDSGTTWSTPSQTAAINASAGDSIMWKATATPNSTKGIGKFSSTANYEVEGNAMSLLFGDNFSGQTSLSGKNNAFWSLFDGSTSLTSSENLVLPATELASGCYSLMFNGCTGLTTAPTELPATTLADTCYQHMFKGCTSLTTAPTLPATALTYSCYNSMFSGCTSLTTAPTLSATTLANNCYGSMFYGCTSLTTAPQLPATTLGLQSYHHMFYGCTSLTTAPTLPATTLGYGCYESMFEGCTSLTTAPTLSATTLAVYCYYSMFGGCTSLTTAPQLPAATLTNDCYGSMFNGCTSLETAPTLSATTLADGCYASMFSGCTSLTTAPTLSATTLAFGCYNEMFYGCTSLTTAPQLPATTLAENCYNSMFSNCTSLTTAPTLSAATLTDECYGSMFNGCTSLSAITCLATDISAMFCTDNWVDGVAASGVFTKAASMNDWTVGDSSGIPNGWTVQNAT